MLAGILFLVPRGGVLSGAEESSGDLWDEFPARPGQVDLWGGALRLGERVSSGSSDIDAYSDYLLRLTERVMKRAEAASPDPQNYLHAAFDVVFGEEGFQQAGLPLSLEELSLQHALTSGKAPELTLAIITMAALRNVPHNVQCLRVNSRYFIRVGSGDLVRFGEVSTGRIRDSKEKFKIFSPSRKPVVLGKRALLGNHALSLGEAARGEGKLEVSERLFRFAWHLSPGERKLYAGLGRLALDRWELARARRCFERALKGSEGFAPAWLGYAKILVRQKRLGEASSALDKVLSVEKTNFEALLTRGRYFLANGEYKAAENRFSRLVERRPRSASAWEGLGLAYLGTSNRKKGEACIERALELGPEDPGAHYAQGEYYFTGQELDLAFNAYKKAIQCNERFAPAYRRRAEVYERWNVPAAALKDYKKYLEILDLPGTHRIAKLIGERVNELKSDLEGGRAAGG